MKKILRALAFAAAVFSFASPSFAQWQTPDHSVPIGRGAGIVGFKNLVPGPLGYIITSNGPGVDPSYQPNANVGTVTSVAAQAGIKSTPNPIVSTGTASLDANYGGFAASNCTLAAAVNSNVLTVSLKDNTGADPTAASPCNINYRSPTLTNGSTSSVPQTAALSVSTFAVGASLGSSNGVPFRLWVVSFNNGGTNVLALINCSTAAGIFPLNESASFTSVPFSAGATSPGVFYTPNGMTVSAKSFRILGYVDFAAGLSTAGTYVSAPTTVQPFGAGVKKPGDVVQTVYPPLGTLTPVVMTTTPTLSNVTASITPTSTVNLVKYSISATLSNSATNGSCTGQVVRGATAIGNVLKIGLTGAATSPGALSFVGLDRPALATTPIAYTMNGVSNGTGNCSIPAINTDSGMVMLEEIMG